MNNAYETSRDSCSVNIARRLSSDAQPQVDFVSASQRANLSAQQSLPESYSALAAPSATRIRPFRLMRFAWGLLLSALGMASILMVGFSLTHIRRFGVDTALPFIALSILIGIMLLGGGFGLMATASAGLADDEFQASFHGAPNPLMTELCSLSDASQPKDAAATQTLAPVQRIDQSRNSLSDQSVASRVV